MNRDYSVFSKLYGVEYLNTTERVPSELMDIESVEIGTQQSSEPDAEKKASQEWFSLLLVFSLGSIIMLSSGLMLSLATFRVIQALHPTLQKVYAPVAGDF